MIVGYMYMLISLKTAPLLKPHFFLFYYYVKISFPLLKIQHLTHFICIFHNLEGCCHLVFNIQSLSLSFLSNSFFNFAFILLCMILYLVLNKFNPASTSCSASIMQFFMIFSAFLLAWPANIQ